MGHLGTVATSPLLLGHPHLTTHTTAYLQTTLGWGWEQVKWLEQKEEAGVCGGARPGREISAALPSAPAHLSSVSAKAGEGPGGRRALLGSAADKQVPLPPPSGNRNWEAFQAEDVGGGAAVPAFVAPQGLQRLM